MTAQIAPAAPAWREATPEEVADDLAGNPLYNDEGGVLEVFMTPEGLYVLEGPTLPCGCVPHVTRMRGIWGFYCQTEDQGYCNFECPHENEED